MRARDVTVTLLVLLAIPATAPGQRKRALKGGREYDLTVAVAGAEGMGFQLHLPQGWRATSKTKYPVLMVLHGNGGAPERTLQVFRKLSTKRTPLILVSPGYQKERRRDAPSWPDAVRNEAFSWIFDQAVSQWHADPDRKFVQGFSRGGACACQYAASLAGKKEAARLRGVILNSGIACGPDTQWPPDTPTLFIVGELETDVGGTNYVEGITRAANDFFRKNVDARLHLLSGMGHTVNDDCLELTRRLIFEECGHGDSLDSAVTALRKRFTRNPRRMSGYLWLERRIASLPEDARAERLRKSLEQLSDHPLMKEEREAWDLLATAREADRKDNPDRKNAYASLARSHAKTEAGRIAADRLTWID